MFIALEGIDGSGKSTQLTMLKEYLESRGRSVYLTREPSDLSIGKTIRRYLTGELKADNRVIAALFVADRLEHILDDNEGLLAIKESGRDIICDRYYFSSYAYQSVDMPMEWIINANSEAAALLKPDAKVLPAGCRWPGPRPSRPRPGPPRAYAAYPPCAAAARPRPLSGG